MTERERIEALLCEALNESAQRPGGAEWNRTYAEYAHDLASYIFRWLAETERRARLEEAKWWRSLLLALNLRHEGAERIAALEAELNKES